MSPATKTPPTSSLPGVKTPGTEGRAGQNINGSIPVAAKPEQRAWELPTRPVPVRQAGGPTGSGLGVKQSTPATGAKGLGAEVTKSWEKANKATEKDIASSVDAWRQAEADIGKEGAMLRSGWYQEAKADADESIRKAMEASAQLGVVMSPYLLGRINVQARAVATAGYRMKSAELALSENAQRLQVASGISNVYQNIQRQGIDPGLAAGMAQQLGVGRAARDANGRLVNDQKTQNNRFLDELDKILNPKKPGAAGSPRPGAPGTPRPPIAGVPRPPGLSAPAAGTTAQPTADQQFPGVSGRGGNPATVPNGAAVPPAAAPKAGAPKVPAYDPVGFTHVSDPEDRKVLVEAGRKARNTEFNRLLRLEIESGEKLARASMEDADKQELERISKETAALGKWLQEYFRNKGRGDTAVPPKHTAELTQYLSGGDGQAQLYDLTTDQRTEVYNAIAENPSMTVEELRQMLAKMKGS